MVMVALYRLKSFRFAVAIAVGELKPYPHFSLPNQNLLLVKHLTTTTSPPEISPPNQQQWSFTGNYLINSCGLSPEGAISASKWVNLKSSENADNVLAFLRKHGFSETQVSKAVRSRPQLLLSDPDKTLLPKIDYLRSIGVSREDLASILTYNPRFLGMSLQKRIIPTFDFLTSMLTHKNAVAVVKYNSKIFSQSYSKNVVPNIGILRELGMPQSHISYLLAHHTHTLFHKPEKFGQVVNEVEQMGFSVEKSTFPLAIRVLSCANYKTIWNRNCKVYSRWGWSEADVLSAFKKCPDCMLISDKRVMQAMDIFVNKMGLPSGMIAKSPYVLTLSLERRIIPRCSVVKYLLSRGLINIENLKISSVLKTVESYFLERFVNRYPGEAAQLMSLYQGCQSWDLVGESNTAANVILSEQDRISHHE